MLDLELSTEQDLLRSTVRGLCETYCPLVTVRELEDGAVDFSTELWHQFGEMDLIGLMLPEQFGGAGMGVVEGVILYEELGRSLAPSPHFVSAVLCGQAISRAGDDRLRETWLPRIVTGDAILTPAWLEPDGSFGPRGVRAHAERRGDGWALTGTKRHVMIASSAERLLVLARTGEATDDIDLFLVDPRAEGVTLTQQFTLASDSQYLVDFDAVALGAGDRVGAAGSGWETWTRVMYDAVILAAAQAMGGAQRAFELSVQYAKDRYQFDKPLGAFQALAHNLADASASVSGGTELVHEAAWARDAGRSTERLAPMAKLFATRTFRDVTALAEHLHGGNGFTVDFDVQLYFRRAKSLQLNWWDTYHLEEMVADAVLG